jgi:type II secretory pathway component GspD/PulD (secretin)
MNPPSLPRLLLKTLLGPACIGLAVCLNAQDAPSAAPEARMTSNLSSEPATNKPAPPAGMSAPQGGSLPEITSEGYWLQAAPINEVFQYLARLANRQFFHNNQLLGPDYQVTGHLKLQDPAAEMEELATAFGLTVYNKGDSVHLLTEEQVARLPLEVMTYPLKYLRGARPASVATGSGQAGGQAGTPAATSMQDVEKIKTMIKPLLTPGTGSIDLEEKTNVLVITDNAARLQRVTQILDELDQPRKQIVINVRILRVRQQKGSRKGIDWTKTLGDGLPVGVSQNLNTLFNLPESSTLKKTNNTSTAVSEYVTGAGLVFNPVEVNGILHALDSNNLVTQESCPSIITEDNEQGVISLVDRFPIIIAQTNASQSNTSITDRVRYKVDEDDPDAAQQPDKSREIGVTLTVTPTLMPDGTIRMKLRPRVANIVELVASASGNRYPRVSESTVEGISRIPDGRSLILGGFYSRDDRQAGNNVPMLGRIPVLGRLFRYNDDSNELVSLVFIITPRVYDAAGVGQDFVSQQMQNAAGLGFMNPEPLGSPLFPESTTHLDPMGKPASPPQSKQPLFKFLFQR